MQVATAKENAANANERAAEAQKQAEEDRLAQVKIEEQLQPRRITRAQETAIVTSLSNADVAANVAIGVVLILSKWGGDVWTWTGIGGFTGIIVATKSSASAISLDAASTLRAALAASGLKVEQQIWPDPWASFGGMLNGPSYKSENSEIRVIVGDKPLP